MTTLKTYWLLLKLLLKNKKILWNQLTASAVNCSHKKLRLRFLWVSKYASVVKFYKPFSQCMYVTIATFTVVVTLVKHSDDVHWNVQAISSFIFLGFLKMIKLLVILFIIKLYARNNIFKQKNFLVFLLYLKTTNM